MRLSTRMWVSAHVSNSFLILLAVMEGVRRDVHTRRLFVMLDAVGDSSSHFFARTNISLDEVKEGTRSQKVRMMTLCVVSMVAHVLWRYDHSFQVVPPYSSHNDMFCIFVDTKRSRAKTLTQNAEPQPIRTYDDSIYDSKRNESKVIHRGQRKHE